MYNIVKPFNIRWEWERYLGKLRELQTSTQHNHYNPVSSNHHKPSHWEPLWKNNCQYLPMDIKRKEGSGSKNNYSYCKVKAAVSKMIDLSESTVKLLDHCKFQRLPYKRLVIETSGLHGLVTITSTTFSYRLSKSRLFFFLLGYAILKDWLFGAKFTGWKFYRWRHDNWPIGQWVIFSCSSILTQYNY